MPRAVLIFNPHAGRGGRSRITALARAANVLRREGIDTEIVATLGPGTAAVQAAGAVASGAEIVFACGGDGTLHEVVQGLAHHPSAVVGVVPLGSANALARHLGLSFDAAEAVHQQLRFEPRLIPLGRVTCETPEGQRSRYFAVMAGAGPDGMLVYRMLAAGKHRLGRAMYYVRAARLFLGSQFPTFRVTATGDENNGFEQEAVSAMAIRVGDLGGVFSPLIRGASPVDETLQLTVTQPPHRFTLPVWFATSWTRTHHWNPYTQHLRVSSFACAAPGHRIHVQADGEWIGTTPMHVELVPNALRLLMPAPRATSQPAR
ncbi:MAG TPA: diacylglycerol kinase family protein [Acidobacteriaceae bacterium]|nr:diacylglycerol kinase family protein [Acidobacteriaceae bacterium]